MMAVCALPAPENGGAGNGADTTAARLFRIWKHPYFDFEIYTCIERLSESNKWKEMDLYRAWWRFVPFQHLEMAMPVTELTAQQLGYFESESAHTLILRSMHVLKD